MEIEKKVSELIKNPIIELGYNVESITYQKEDGTYYLRVIIDKTNGITVDDCVEVSNLINPMLDEADLIDDNYILDVCSK